VYQISIKLGRRELNSKLSPDFQFPKIYNPNGELLDWGAGKDIMMESVSQRGFHRDIASSMPSNQSLPSIPTPNTKIVLEPKQK